MRRRRRRPAPGLARSQARCYTLRVVSSASRTAVTIIRLPNRSPGENTCRMISAVSAGCASSKLSPLDFIGGFERLGIARVDGDA